jgi:hypothetical protein
MQNETPAPLPSQPASTVQDSQEPTANGDVQNDTSSDLTQVALEVLALLPSLL